MYWSIELLNEDVAILASVVSNCNVHTKFTWKYGCKNYIRHTLAHVVIKNQMFFRQSRKLYLFNDLTTCVRKTHSFIYWVWAPTASFRAAFVYIFTNCLVLSFWFQLFLFFCRVYSVSRRFITPLCSSVYRNCCVIFWPENRRQMPV